MLEPLKKKNPQLEIFSVEDPFFENYGCIHKITGGQALLQTSTESLKTDEGTRYTASDPRLETGPAFQTIERRIFGETPIQAGCCYGFNTRLGGMEFHKSSELIGAATPLVLLLGRIQEIKAEGTWDSRHTKAFYIPQGRWIELYATTLHLAPCRVNASPFNAVIVLPRGTNTPLKHPPEGCLWMENKWMLAHPDGPAAAKGAFPGVRGENIQVIPL